MTTQPSTVTIRTALVGAVPISAPVFVFGISFGVLASAADVTGWQAALMCLTVFAGSSQFAALSILAAGGSPAAAVFSGALLNLRYLATGAAVRPVLRGGRLRRSLEAQLVVDESFAVAVAASDEGEPPNRVALLVTGVALYVAWVAGSVTGSAVGPVLGDPVDLGLDAAFPALFVALLWTLLRRRSDWVMAAAGGVVALVVAPFTPPGVPLAAAAVAGLVLAGRTGGDDDRGAASTAGDGLPDGGT